MGDFFSVSALRAQPRSIGMTLVYHIVSARASSTGGWSNRAAQVRQMQPILEWLQG